MCGAVVSVHRVDAALLRCRDGAVCERPGVERLNSISISLYSRWWRRQPLLARDAEPVPALTRIGQGRPESDPG